MRAPLSWLKDFVDIVIPLDTLVDRMTMAGLEVGGGRGILGPIGSATSCSSAR